jgi:hypothetical protein
MPGPVTRRLPGPGPPAAAARAGDPTPGSSRARQRPLRPAIAGCACTVDSERQQPESRSHLVTDRPRRVTVTAGRRRADRRRLGVKYGTPGWPCLKARARSYKARTRAQGRSFPDSEATLSLRLSDEIRGSVLVWRPQTEHGSVTRVDYERLESTRIDLD